MSGGTILPPWVFAIDVSPSMEDDIEQVELLVENLLNELDDDESVSRIILTLFQNAFGNEFDADFHTQTKAFADSQSFLHEIQNNIDVQDGSTCREASLTAIEVGIEAISQSNAQPEGANVFVFTDADPQLNTPEPTVTEVINTRNTATDGLPEADAIKVHIIMSGSCDESVNPDTGLVTYARPQEFIDIASQTGGILLATTKDNIGDALQLLRPFLSSSTTEIDYLRYVESGEQVEIAYEPTADTAVYILATGPSGTTPEITVTLRDAARTEIVPNPPGSGETGYIANANSGFARWYDAGYSSGEPALPWFITIDIPEDPSRRRLQSDESGYTNQIVIYATNAVWRIVFGVSNVLDDDINQMVDTNYGQIYYDSDESFAVYGYPRVINNSNGTSFTQDDFDDFDFDSIVIEDRNGNASISKTVTYDSNEGFYYALFKFDELDALELYQFAARITGITNFNTSFSRVSSTVWTVSGISISLDCTAAEANGFEFFIGESSECDISMQRTDVDEEAEYEIEASIVNTAISTNTVLLTLSKDSVTLRAGVDSFNNITLTVTVVNSRTYIGDLFDIKVTVVNDDEEETNFDVDGHFVIGGPSLSPSSVPTGNPTESPITDPTRAPTYVPSKQPSKAPSPNPTPMPTDDPSNYPSQAPTYAPTACPAPCNSDPCSDAEIKHCTVYNEGFGCSQCMSGYFKPGDNYNCLNCNETFGIDCLFCQDYNGCGQCAAGTARVYNDECQLWECQSQVGIIHSTNSTCGMITDKCASEKCGIQCPPGFWRLFANTTCVSCDYVFGENCVFCQDYHGCGQCADGYTLSETFECGPGILECV